MENRINKRKVVTGIVVRDKMIKTRVVQVDSMRRHPRYGKQVKFTARYKAHDEKNEAKAGDLVEIMETRPISKDKRWVILSIVKKGEDIR